MKTILTGAVIAAGLAFSAPSAAAPGQCSMTGYADFACDIDADGGGLTFALPDRQMLVFSQLEAGEGLGYLIGTDAEPGERPRELGMFTPIEGRPGCWFGDKDDITFCAAVEQ